MFNLKTEDTFNCNHTYSCSCLFQGQQLSTLVDVSYFHIIFYIYFIDAYGMGWTIQSLDAGRDNRSSLLKNVADQLWGPPSITFSGYCFFFARSEVARV